MLSCYIVDDEAHAIETLASYIEKTPGLKLLGSSTNPLEALEIIGSSVHPDITFLDVDMPQLSGIDLAGLINDRTAVIFTTAFPNYALEAFEKNASDYLLKPISFDRFLISVKKVSSLIRPTSDKPAGDHIYVKSSIKGKLIKINITDIMYAESIKNYLVIYTGNEKLITYLTLGELEKVLPENQFFRVHRSFLVNANMIKSISGSTIQLLDNTQISLGTMYKSALQDYINNKLIKSSRQP